MSDALSLPPDVTFHLAERTLELAATLDAVANGPNTSQRELAGVSLAAVLAFLRQTAIAGPAVQALQTLSNELLDVELNGRHGALLTGPRSARRPPDPPEIESIKGRLAALLDLHAECRKSKRGAAEWLAKQIPGRLAKKLNTSGRGVTARAILDWHERFADSNSHSMGRNAFVAMLALAERVFPGGNLSEANILRMLDGLAGRVFPDKSPS